MSAIDYNQTSWIYALSDPVDKKVRYVGYSVDPNNRFKQHLRSEENAGKYRWICNLKESGLQPSLEILEKTTRGDCGEKETYWIAKYRADGAILFNQTDGGNAPPELSPESLAKKSISISSVIQQQWDAGHYDGRAKTGPKSDKTGQVKIQDHEDIVDLYNMGLGVKKIGEIYNVHHKTITTVLKKLGAYQPKPDHTDEIIRLYTEEMLSVEKVAERIEGISTTVVKNRLKENNIPIRNKTSYSSLSEEMVIDALRRQRNGEKVRHMAAEFGVKEGTLQERFRRLRKKGY